MTCPCWFLWTPPALVTAHVFLSCPPVNKEKEINDLYKSFGNFAFEVNLGKNLFLSLMPVWVAQNMIFKIYCTHWCCVFDSVSSTQMYQFMIVASRLCNWCNHFELICLPFLAEGTILRKKKCLSNGCLAYRLNSLNKMILSQNFSAIK